MTHNHGEPIQKETANVAAEQLARLRELFPEAFTEGKVDWDKLRATLGHMVDDGPERYTFTWAGKRDGIRLLQTPTRATLIPCREESVDFDQTWHIFIEGDNYEAALKEGYGLNCQITPLPPAGEGPGVRAFRVSDPDKEQSFTICLDNAIRLENLSALNLDKDDLFICRDVALDDEAAANLALQCRLKTI